MIKLLGLDQSQTATGWSIGTPDDTPPVSGVFRSAPWGDYEGRGLVRFSHWLHDLIQKYDVTHCVYEEPYIPKVMIRNGVKHGNVDIDAIKPMLFLEGQINFQCHMDNVTCKKVEIGVWRKRFLGTTRADPGLTGDDATFNLKQKSVSMCAKYGWLIADHNEAEARGIMVYGLADISEDYARKTGPASRRADLVQMNKEFRGE